MPVANMSPHSSIIATYDSPSDNHAIQQDLPSVKVEASPTEIAAYLSDLRKSLVKAQDEVNDFLTRKMQADQQTVATKNGIVDEDREEDNYGEEAEDDD